MHIHEVNLYTRLLRTSFREGGKIRKHTVANVSHFSAAQLEALRAALAEKRARKPAALDLSAAEQQVFAAFAEHGWGRLSPYHWIVWSPLRRSAPNERLAKRGRARDEAKLEELAAIAQNGVTAKERVRAARALLRLAREG